MKEEYTKGNQLQSNLMKTHTEAAREFMIDVSVRLANRVQLTTDGHRVYLTVVEEAFEGDIDYAMLQKLYDNDHGASKGEKKYSPATCIGTETNIIHGRPEEKHVSTRYVERQNLTMRMHMRRFTRLTNAFSKKLENHYYAIALHFVYYNFVKQHKTLRVTPAMEGAGRGTKYKIAEQYSNLRGEALTSSVIKYLRGKYVDEE